jgi:DNA-binding transcriptional LysR family regulator
VNLSAVDLNLLPVLQAVLAERNATRAAARLHVTQSAVSNALARLRRVFADPLVVRVARGLEPTPRALELAPRLDALLTQLDGLISAASAFEPARSTRRFTVACSDAIEFVVIPHLAALMAKRLPRASLRVVTIDHMVASNGLATGEVDLLIGMPPTLPPGCTSERLFRDDMVCVVRAGHPTIRGRKLTLAAYVDTPHVEVALFGRADPRVDTVLARIHRARRIAVSVPHFSAIAPVVEQTSAIATLARRLAGVLAHRRPLRLLPLPIELPPIEIVQIHHARTDGDAGTQYLRGLVRLAAEPARKPTSRAGLAG